MISAFTSPCGSMEKAEDSESTFLAEESVDILDYFSSFHSYHIRTNAKLRGMDPAFSMGFDTIFHTVTIYHCSQ